MTVCGDVIKCVQSKHIHIIITLQKIYVRLLFSFINSFQLFDILVSLVTLQT